MNIVQVIFLGVVQGITEFLPVSSSGHLALMQTLFNLDAKSPEMLLFDLAVHLGTLVSVVIVFCGLLPGPASGAVSITDSQGGLTEVVRSVSKWRLLLMIVVATMATGILVMPAKKLFTQAFGSLSVVALMWIVTGTLLWATDLRKQCRCGLSELGLGGAFVIGLAQGVAVVPGISRSGATICIAILMGLGRTHAVAFSLLIGVPAVLGATLVESLDEWEVLTSGSVPIWSLLLGGLAAAAVGVAAIKLLVRFASVARLRYFGYYCYALAFLVLAHSLMR
jgi:undecaprenyl-diphosphatase